MKISIIFCLFITRQTCSGELPCHMCNKNNVKRETCVVNIRNHLPGLQGPQVFFLIIMLFSGEVVRVSKTFDINFSRQIKNFCTAIFKLLQYFFLGKN